MMGAVVAIIWGTTPSMP